MSPSTLIHTCAPVSSESHGLSIERGAALAEGEGGGALGQREPVAVLLDHAAPLVGAAAPVGPAGGEVGCLHAHSPSPSTRITEETSRTSGMRVQRRDRRRQGGVGGAVRDDHELGVVAAALLAHRLDGHAVLGERLRDRGEHTGAVVDVDGHVVAGGGLPHRAHRQLGVRRLAGPADVDEPVARHRDEVAQHRGGGGRAAGAGAVEHQLAGRLALDEDGVEGLAHAGQRVAARDHRGVHARRDRRAVGAVGQLADRQQLDHGVHLARRGDVGRAHVGDALAVDVGGHHTGVEGEAGEDGGLGRGVEPLDVGRRVGLGVAEGLGLLQRLGEPGAGGVHLVEDEVRGAVDDAEHAADPVAGQGLAQRTQDRDGAGDGGLVVEVAVVLLGGGEQRRRRPRPAAPCWRSRRWRRARGR